MVLLALHYIPRVKAGQPARIEVISSDQPALLYRISEAIYESGLNIYAAKVHTEGERAQDVFTVGETTYQQKQSTKNLNRKIKQLQKSLLKILKKKRE